MARGGAAAGQGGARGVQMPQCLGSPCLGAIAEPPSPTSDLVFPVAPCRPCPLIVLLAWLPSFPDYFFFQI